MGNYQRFPYLTLYAGTSRFSVSEVPPDGVNRDKARQGDDTTLMLHTNRNRNPSSVLNSIPLTSGDGSDLGHYCAEIVTLELRTVSVGGGLPGRVPAI